MQQIVSRLGIGVAVTAIGMWAADSSLGTWKLNAAKSKSTSTNAIKSLTDVREATADGGVKSTRTGQMADGTAINYSYSCKYDGKECPVTGAAWDVIVIKRVNANTTAFEIKKTGGKLHSTGRSVVSQDGKTRTQTGKGTGADGKPVLSTMIFEKQEQVVDGHS